MLGKLEEDEHNTLYKSRTCQFRPVRSVKFWPWLQNTVSWCRERSKTKAILISPFVSKEEMWT